MSIAIFFGSTTGNTEYAADMISAELGAFVSHMSDIADTEAEELLKYDVLMLGIPTWNVGEMQDDWDDFLPNLKGLDFTGKKIALFGMGDADGYPENFLDALGLLWDELKELGKPELIGIWPTESYTFEESKGLFDEKHFLGLGLDEENEPHLHEERVKRWTKQILEEANLS